MWGGGGILFNIVGNILFVLLRPIMFNQSSKKFIVLEIHTVLNLKFNIKLGKDKF